MKIVISSSTSRRHYVNNATRGQNLLDLVLSTEPCMVDALEICCAVANSDHNGIIFKLIYETILENSNVKAFSYHKSNSSEINNALCTIEWEDRFENKLTEDIWLELIAELLECRSK